MNRGLTSMSNPGMELGVEVGMGVGGGDWNPPYGLLRGNKKQGQTVYLNCPVWEVPTPSSLTKSWSHQRTFKPWSSLLTSSLKTRLLVYARLFLSCLFLQSDDFAHDIFALALLFVSQSSLAQLCSRCFWRWSWRLHSWDSSVLSLVHSIHRGTFLF